MNSSQSTSRKALEVISNLKNWWSKVGLFSRVILYLCTGFFILCLIFSFNLSTYFTNNPSETIVSYEVYRLFTCPFITNGTIAFLISILVFLPEAARMEREAGTILSLLDFLYLNLQIQLVFTLAIFLVSIAFPSVLKSVESFGLLPLYLAYVTKRCLKNPEQKVYILCIPYEIKARLYPFILLVLFAIVTMSIRVDLLAAIGVGYLHHELFWARLSISREKVHSLENHPILAPIVKNSQFIPVEVPDILNLSFRAGNGVSSTKQSLFEGKNQKIGTNGSKKQEKNKGSNDIELSETTTNQPEIEIVEDDRLETNNHNDQPQEKFFVDSSANDPFDKMVKGTTYEEVF